MLKRFSLAILACKISLMSFAQQPADIQTPKIVPPSADAAALGKYGQIPVDKSTGIPSISIPLYEIKTPRFSLPISFSYHASGIKVEEMSSWVGAGWSLNAGGVITRSIIGFTDDEGYGILTNHNRIKKASQIQWPNDITYISDVVTKHLDTEPDNFFFNFSNHSGSFVFGNDTKPVIIPYQPIKINFNSSTKEFIVTDEQGNSYYFSTKEYVTSFISSEMSGISSWYLTKIVSADLSDTIQFEYTTDAAAQTEYSFNFTQDLSDLCNENHTTLRQLVKSQSLRQFYPVRLSRIIFRGGRIDFIVKGGRLDDGKVSLDEIVVSNSNPATGQYDKFKSFKLQQDYFYSTYAVPDYGFFSVSEADKYRLKLTGLDENDATGTVVKTHRFEYNSTMLPQVHSFAQDNWGYFNGNINNKTLLESKQITFQESANPSVPNSVALIGGNEGADRSVSETSMKAGVLEKIIYPTKGYTVFNYECNKVQKMQYADGYFNVSAIGALNQGGSQEINTQLYTPTGDMINSGGTIFTVKLSSGNNPYGSSLTQYVKVVRVSDGAAIYDSYQLGLANTQVYNLVLPLVANVQYAITAEAHGTAGPPSSQSPYAIIFTNYKVPTGLGTVDVGGLRVKAIKNYNSEGTLTTTETYRYGSAADMESGSGVEIAGLSANMYGRAAVCTSSSGNPDFPSGIPNSYVRTFSNNSIYPLSTINGSPVGYSSVNIYQGDIAQNTGKSIYKYDIHPDSVAPIFGFNINLVKPFSVSWKNGEPVWEGHYRNNGSNQYTLVSETSNEYGLIYKPGATGTVMGYRPEPMGDGSAGGCAYFNYPTICPRNGLVYTCNLCDSLNRLDWSPLWLYWYDYSISTGMRLLKKSTTTSYSADGLASLEQTTSYDYSNLDHVQPTAITTTNSKGETYKKQLKYPVDYPSVEPYATMVSRNIITPVIEQLTYKGATTTPLQANKNNYGFWNGTAWTSSATNFILPQTTDTKTLNQSSYETRLRYVSYDDQGNIATVSKENDVKKTYLWGYNKQYPVAEITGADYATASSYVNQSSLDAPADDATLRSQLNNLRNIPGTLVTTYTYKPLVGMTSSTDANGRTNYYIYDAFGRLDFIKDKDNNVVKKLCYNYLGQPGACTIFGNTVQSGTFTKNDCSYGYSGTQVTYSVPANSYYASTQADANTLALTSLNNAGQAYANQNGSCTVPPVNVSGHSSIGYPYTVRFTNTSTSQQYYMYLSPNSSSSVQMPVGTYNISFYPSSGSYVYTYYYVNGYSSYGAGANFSNISIGSGSSVNIGN